MSLWSSSQPAPTRRDPRRRLIAVGTVVLGLILVTTLVPAHAAPDEPSTGPATEPAGVPAGNVVFPRLVARATLSADYLAPGPPSGALAAEANGRKGPFDGQVIPGFSAAVANANGTFWAMPDNGFGAKGNSADFLLRIYLIRPRWERAAGGPGSIEILRIISCATRTVGSTFPSSREHRRVCSPATTSTSSHSSGCRTAASGSERSSAPSCFMSTPAVGC